MKHIRTVALAVAGVAGLAMALPASAQQLQAREGFPLLAEADLPPGYVPEFGTMWTFDAPPLDYWEARYGFTPEPEWLEHLRLSTIRLPGCSSSFVSENGLVMTNHHCVRGCIAAVSPEETSYLRTGFVAGTQAEELVCPGTYVDQLVGIEDVTDRIRSAVTATEPEEQVAQRDAAIEAIQEECAAGTGHRCQVVSFYNGGMYSLYTYRRYDELRLVFAPELAIAHFGGDPDNFTYPRYSLDVAFLRAYDDGEPVRPEHWLEWSDHGPDEGDVVFVVGNPGSTGRLLTQAQMEYLRDVVYPARIDELETRLDLLRSLAEESPEAARRYETAILGAENSYKATRGYLTGLLDATIMERKQAFEADFRSRIDADPNLRERFGGTWDAIADAQLELATFATPARYYDLDGSTLLDYASSLVRLVRQSELPEDERLPGYEDERLDRIRQGLLRDRDPDPVLERAQLAAWLEAARRDLGPDDALVRMLLQGRSPDRAAAELVQESRLASVAVRRALLEGGLRALRASDDPLVQAALELEPTGASYARRAAELNAVISANTELLGSAIYEAYGKALPPDATFTLRISDGVAAGFPMNGTIAPYRTVFYGLYGRAASFGHQVPFELPESWHQAQPELDMETPMNFVATADIIGGNSGSPVVNRAGEVVGLVFDGNIQMLPNRFIFTDEISRSVSVHSEAILEALRKVYDAAHIADEIR
ncbi:MAG: S46 family peptidase [Gemmatimonadota bacterium]